jgi:hypothetical protein
VYFFASLDSQENFIPFGFSLSNIISGELLSEMVKKIGEVAKNLFQEDATLSKISKPPSYKPLIMNDGGSAEMSMNKILTKEIGSSYILCRFHLIKNYYDYLNQKCFKDVDKKNKKMYISEIMSQVYLILATYNSIEFFEQYAKFKLFVENKKNAGYTKFLNYFEKIYLNQYESINIQSRDLNLNLKGTNNLMELFIRGVTNSLPRNKKKFTRL